eukprot:scaffold134577_cov63-Cyclotella_meneghiniana.AAC.3
MGPLGVSRLQGGPSTPCSPLTVGSRYAAIPDRQRSAAGWLPSERHQGIELKHTEAVDKQANTQQASKRTYRCSNQEN